MFLSLFFIAMTILSICCSYRVNRLQVRSLSKVSFLLAISIMIIPAIIIVVVLIIISIIYITISTQLRHHLIIPIMIVFFILITIFIQASSFSPTSTTCHLFIVITHHVLLALNVSVISLLLAIILTVVIQHY